MRGSVVHKDICSLNLIMRHLRPLVQNGFWGCAYTQIEMSTFFPTHALHFGNLVCVYDVNLFKKRLFSRKRLQDSHIAPAASPAQHLLRAPFGWMCSMCSAATHVYLLTWQKKKPLHFISFCLCVRQMFGDVIFSVYIPASEISPRHGGANSGIYTLKQGSHKIHSLVSARLALSDHSAVTC